MHQSENSTAQILFDEIKIVCWVMTYPDNHDKKAIHVKATWGKRCNKIIFMSSKNDSSLPSIDLKVVESRKTLWGKTKAAFQYVYKHHLNDADWFVKADDDTFMIMENLRFMLSQYNSSQAWYFGCQFREIS